MAVLHGNVNVSDASVDVDAAVEGCGANDANDTADDDDDDDTNVSVSGIGAVGVQEYENRVTALVMAAAGHWN